MADPTQIVGTPALNPPAPNEPGWLADTPQSTDNYDVVIGGIGFMLYRGEDNNPPDRRFKTEPLDLTYAPIFVDRSNVSGNLGDDQQAFYMTFVQRDWSGGIGQKYFRKDVDPQSRMFWEGSRIMPTTLPGAVKLGGIDSITGAGSSSLCERIVYFNQAGASRPLGDTRAMLLRFEGNTATTVTYQYSTDGGTTWTTQPTSAGPLPNDIVDAVTGDDGNVYLLEGNSGGNGTTATIHRISGPSIGATLAWNNATVITGSECNALAYWNANLYVADQTAKLKQVAFGTSSAQTVIKDFGGGIIIQLLPTPRGLYILYLTVQGDYRCYLYDGTANVQEVARLPSGWRMHFVLEGQTDTLPGFNSSKPHTQHALAWLDGVLYAVGMLPARDYQQANGGQTPFRTALWYYASGNSGIIWAAENTSKHAWNSGGSGAIAIIKNGLIAFTDTMNSRIMAYDPGTGGVVPIATLATTPTFTALATTTVSGTINSLATTIQISGPGANIGDVFTAGATGEQALVTKWVASGATQTLTILRGYNNTTPSDSTFVNANTITITPAIPYPWALIYDPVNELIVIPYTGNPTTQFYNIGNRQQVACYYTVKLRPGPDFGGAVTGLLATSLFDFDSSLPKYFKDAMWDGDTLQFPNLTTETAGTVDLYYKLDGTANATTDTGVVLIQAGAVPGTRYNINATGRSICLLAVLNAAAGTGAKPISQGPIIRRLAVRGTSINPGYRYRAYQIALFSDIRTKQGFIEPRTGAVLRRNLETLMAAGAPVNVSDAGMTNVSCVIMADKCTFREMKPNEWVAYVEVREV